MYRGKQLTHLIYTIYVHITDNSDEIPLHLERLAIAAAV